MKFEITLRQTRVDYLVVEVDAPNATLARREARKLGEEQPNDFCDGNVVKVDVHNIREIE